MKPVYAFTLLTASLAIARPAPIPEHAVEARSTGLIARSEGILQKVERRAADFLTSLLEAPANEEAGFIGNGTKHHGHQGHNGTEHHGHQGHHNGTHFNGTFGIEHHGNKTHGSQPIGIASAFLALSTDGARPEHRHNGTDGEREHHHHNGTDNAEPTGTHTHSHHSHSASPTSSAAVEKRQESEATPTASFRFPSGSGFPQHSGHARPTGAFPSGFPSGAAFPTGSSHSGFPSGIARPTGHHSHSHSSFPSGVAMPTSFPQPSTNGTGNFKDAIGHFFGRLAFKA